MEVCFLFNVFTYFFARILLMPASAAAEVSSVTVCSCWDVIPVFSDMLTGIRGRQGKKRGRVKGSQNQSQNHTGVGVMWLFFAQMEPGSSSFVSLFVVFDV